jgi:MFS family permease
MPDTFAVTGPATGASSVLAGLTVAAVPGGPVLGVLLDRAARPGRLLVTALAVYVAGLVVVLAGLGRVPVAGLVAVAVVTGSAGPALSGGWTAQLPGVVRGGSPSRAGALDAMSFSLAALAGPAPAGLGAELLGAPPAVVFAVGLLGLALPVAWRLPPGRTEGRRRRAPPHRRRRKLPPHRNLPPHGKNPPPHREPPTASETPTAPERAESLARSVRRDLVAGVAAIARNACLARATLTSVLTCFANGVLTGCLPVIGEQVLGGASRGAMLMACAAASAVAANALMAARRRRTGPMKPDSVVRRTALVQAAAIALTAVAGPHAVIVAALLFGAGEGPHLTALIAVRHREAPERMRSQVFTTGASLKITGFALGSAFAGPAAAWSLPGALLLASAVVALAVPAQKVVRAGVVPACT